MQRNPVYYFFVVIVTLSLFACSSDEMVLTVGEGVINDDHDAYFTDLLKATSETRLAKYVQTNNTGVALCGSYNDEYIGDITTNTVFKISPHISTDDYSITNATFDSMVLVLKPTGYLFGDSTQALDLSVYEVTENYTLDTLTETVSEITSTYTQLNNNSTTSYDPIPWATFSFIPEDEDSVVVRLPDSIGKLWLENIILEDDDYMVDDATSDDPDFIENVLNGLTIRNAEFSDNAAVIGFKMSTSDVVDPASTTIRIYYHTTGPYEEKYFDFKIFDADHQYNQVSADFTQGVLNGIVAGGDGIPSTATEGLTFVQSGLGLMTNIEITSLYELFLYGQNLTIIDLDLDFSAKPRSFRDNKLLPTALTVEKFQKNETINPYGLLDFSGSQVYVSKTLGTDRDATYSVPITAYGWEEQELLGTEDTDHNTLLIRGTYDDVYPANINRLVLGDSDNKDCEMLIKMYYTYFD